MSTLYSPKIKTDGLVFMYDTGNRKSYPGEPTTNYGPASFGDWGTESTAERIATGNTFNGQPTYNCRTVVGQSYRGIEKTISGLRTAAGSSGTVTMSCMVRNNNSTSYSMFAYIGHDFTSTRNIAANSDWQKVQWTVNQSSMNNDYVEFRPYTNNASIYLEMTMPMVEVNKGHATQFVDGTRSATQGLIDRTGNTTIDLSNVSFDSNAQMTFDGTDDYIPLTGNILNVDAFTVEAVVNITSTGNYNKPIFVAGNLSNSGIWFFKHRSGLGNRLVMHGYDGVNPRIDGVCVNQVPDAQNTYVAVTFDGSAYQLYMNGELEGSPVVDNKVGATTTNYIGKQSSIYLDGDIPTMKIYNKALTPDEILQNFNATKSRFGL